MPDMNSPGSTGNNPWFAATLGLLGIIVGYTVASTTGASFGNWQPAPVAPSAPTAQQPTAPTPPPTNDTPAEVDDDPMIGDEDATITLIEFTDYQCPFCSRHFQQTYGQIKKDYIDTGKVKYVSRDFPLGFHPHAQKASEASECADDQGKFWEMHDELFNKQGEWSQSPDAVAAFKKMATDLGLNAGTFNTCLDSGKYKAEVEKDLADGQASGIDGTPGFWIIGPDGTGQKISGAYPFETFKAAFDGLLD
mgnify:CR=1 FL=1